MSDVFNTILNMSITGSVVILVVIIVRFVLRNIPKKYSYILWSAAGFRLCCPFSFRSVVSLFNINPVQKPEHIVTDSGTMNYIDAPVYTQAPQTNISAVVEAEAPAIVIAQHHFTDFIPYIWISGLIILVVIGAVNFLKTRKQLLTATKKYDNIYQSESITSPFILGIIKPKIYIPYSIDEEYFDYVIAHEKYHLKRRDNIIKLLAFVLLCIHWFNPFCWLAFYLVNKDMEMSCDEWVLSCNNGIKKVYSNALLSFAAGKKFPTPTPLCFGEGSAKSRIKNVLKYRKPAVAVSIIAIILCIAVTIVCIANPIDNKEKELIKNQNTNDIINTNPTEPVNENNENIFSVGKPVFLDLKQSFNPSVIESIEIKQNKVNIITNNNVFYGIVTRTENIKGSEFFKYWNDFGLSDVSPFDTSIYNNIEIKYICEDINSYDAKYSLYYFDNELMLIGFVYQDESDNDILSGISEIENGIYKQQIISQSKAIKIAYEKLSKEFSPEMSFRFDGIELIGKSEQFLAFNTNYNPNDSGHSYYGVSFMDNNSIADFYYYCIDSITGEMIYSGMMGD